MSGGERESRWERVDRLFARALDLTGEERDRFLEELARRQPEIALEVEELLRDAESGDDPLDVSTGLLESSLRDVFLDDAYVTSSSADAAPGSHVLPGEPEIGRTVGPWRLLRLLGRGGMGAVYLAERADGAYETRVALKVLRSEARSEELLARFLVERQILASLDHPAIAGLLDGGASEDGRPYLAMEYVEGRPVTEYCAEEGLTTEERLRLFLTIGRAVHHAHRNLVVHRDLKPSNVLVTSDDRVKLLDFGIAKILDDSGVPAAAPRTRTGSRLLTPEYASPEQVRGEPVTTSSDVYQLGLLLYEMLTGTLPYEADGPSLGALERAICETDPTAPSQATVEVRERNTRRASDESDAASGAERPLAGVPPRKLRGDLDRIVLMALRKEPERRYGSAEQMVEDVERYLRDRPVVARDDTWTYRARRFVGRNRWPVAAAVALFLSLGGWIFTLQTQSNRLQAERDRARTEAAESEQVQDFLVSLFETADPTQTGGDEVTARELLDRGAERIRRELGDQPEVRAKMLATIAGVYPELGLGARGLPLAEEALEIRRRHLGEDHPDVAETLLLTARLTAPSDPDSADVLYRRAIDVAQAAYGPDHPAVARAMSEYGYGGTFLDDTVRWRLADSAIGILRSAQGDHRELLAQVLTTSAYADPPPSPDAGIARLSEALALQGEVYGASHPYVATTLSDLAGAISVRDPDSAEVLLRKALAMHRETAGPRHTSTLTLANNLAGMLRDRGKFAPAESLYRQVLTARKSLGADPHILAYPLYGLGRTLAEQGRGRDAEPFLREVLESEAFPEGDQRHVLVRATLGWALQLQGRLEEARAELRGALAEARASEVARGAIPFVEERLEAVDRLADGG